MPRSILIYETVLDELKRRVADGELRPGDRLPSVQQLSREFHVGVSSVREALRVLAATGVVRIEQGRGVFVSAQLPAVDELRERFTTTEAASLKHLVEARRIIEPEVAALAAQRATTAHIDQIWECARRMDRNFRAGRDWMEADLGFHAALCEAAENPVIAGMLQRTNDLLIDSRRETMRDRAVSERACHFHLLIASAVADHKPLLARALMQEHMDDAVAVFDRLDATSGPTLAGEGKGERQASA